MLRTPSTNINYRSVFLLKVLFLKVESSIKLLFLVREDPYNLIGSVETVPGTAHLNITLTGRRF